MHIIIDIRALPQQDASSRRSGIAWASMWQRHRKDDVLSFLMYEHQLHIDGFNCIVAPEHFGPIGKKHLRPRSGKEIFRCVSFSSYAPYDTSISTTLHTSSNARIFYPPPMESAWRRRIYEYFRKRMITSVTTIVVPDIQIGRELVELYNIDEERIEIIPHLPLEKIPSTVSSLQKIPTPKPYYIYDATYGNEANLLSLLTAWERYRHDGGTYELLLVGSAGSYLSDLTHMIRSLALGESVRYIGSVDDGTLHTLYQNARAWIYVGPYYAAAATIEMARAYELPMLLSDISALRGYAGIHVHPNHISDIVIGLTRMETAQHTTTRMHQEESYIEAYEKILAKKI